jgi:hypothetical protein
MEDKDDDFWEGDSVARTTEPPPDLSLVIGSGRDLWASDAEFHAFVDGIYERRRADRDAEQEQG